MCMPRWEVGMLGTVYFIGWASTLLWLPRFGDKFGRQKVFATGMTLTLIMYTLLLWTTNYYVMLGSIFAQGTLTSIRINVGWIYLIEMMPKHVRTRIGTFYGSLDACVYLMATIYFWKIGKDWFYFGLIGYVLCIISAVGAWFLPESPLYLCEKGQMYELERSLKAIAKLNGKTL